MSVFGKDLLAMIKDVLERYRGLNWTEATAALPQPARRNLRRHAKKDFNPALEVLFELLRAHRLNFCGVNQVEHLVALIQRQVHTQRLTQRVLCKKCTFSRNTLLRLFSGGTVHIQPILELLERIGLRITISPVRTLKPVK